MLYICYIIIHKFYNTVDCNCCCLLLITRAYGVKNDTAILHASPLITVVCTTSCYSSIYTSKLVCRDDASKWTVNINHIHCFDVLQLSQNKLNRWVDVEWWITLNGGQLISCLQFVGACHDWTLHFRLYMQTEPFLLNTTIFHTRHTLCNVPVHCYKPMSDSFM